MKWVAISGSWRTINEEVKNDVKSVVERVIKEGDGIITGGALGVDYIATHTVLEHGDVKKQLKLFLPVKLDSFCRHYFERAREEVITREQAERITNQLRKVHGISEDSIIDEFGFSKADKESYYVRNTKIIEACDELYAFQVNNSEGVQDAIDKAKTMSKKVHVKEYKIND